jgi:acyl dehydratase
MGAEWRTRSRTITESDIVQFAALTGDFTYLHTDAERAAASPFGSRIAHGALVFSYSIGLITQLNATEESVLAFYGLDRLRFVRPVRIGDTITVERKVIGTRSKPPGGGVVTFDTAVVNQRGEIVVAYIDKVLLKTRA